MNRLANISHAVAPLMLSRMAQPQPQSQNPLSPAIPQASGMDTYRRAISNIESGSPEGDYSTIGPVTRRGNRAYGRYQVMDFNIGPWTREVLGREYTPQEFLSDPRAQDAVFDAKFRGYIDRYGSPENAAAVWFGGPGGLSNPSASDGYIDVAEYRRRFNSGMR